MKLRHYFYLIGISFFCSPAVLASCYPMPLPPFFFCVLDREGTGMATPPDYYTCHENFEFEEAGGKPFFKIKFNGYCGIHPGGGLPGWTPVPWKSVSVQARYNYDTQVAEEQIWHTNQVMLKSEHLCTDNPWANTPDCTIQGSLTNNTGVKFDGALPVSAYRMSHSLRQALAKWENTPSNEELLSDWNPYSGSVPSGFDISSPAQYQVVAEGATDFQVAVELPSGTTPPENLELEWQKIIPAPAVVGDIALPSSATHWWEPFFGPAYVQWSALPMSIDVNPGYFAGKPGLYQLRVRNYGSGGWSIPRRFWVGAPGFEPPPESFMKDKIKVSVAAKNPVLQPVEKRSSVKTNQVDTRVQITAKPERVLVKQPRLKVTRISWDEASARPGSPVNLVVTVENNGKAVSRANQQRLYFACLPTRQCPKSAVVYIPVDIAQGQSVTFTVPDAVQPLKGNTRFFVSTEPVNLAHMR